MPGDDGRRGDELEMSYLELDDARQQRRWGHESGRHRKESSKRERPDCRAIARCARGCGHAVAELYRFAGSRKDGASGKNSGAPSASYRALAVLTGDIQTENDAMRLRRYGYPVRQITTAGACHLDARMVEKHLGDWLEEGLELLLIENVGNLVCPTSYDLGEDAKIVVLSVAEGEDKPLKYPGIFRKAELMILNKIDLLPYVPFKPELARENARRIHPEIEIIETSCTTGAGFDQWLNWLAARAERKKASAKAVAELAPIH